MAAKGHEVAIERVGQRFGDYVAVDDVSLTVGGGELVALLGPSGCGKSTLLRIIAGFIAQTEGRILFDGASVDHLPANRRGVGIVFQNYALFPHMTVRENVAYGLRAQKWKRDDIAPRVEEMLGRVHMAQFGDRYPRQLSGGQQQRIALARCLATDPKVLLLDEPFAALDKNLRFDMQIEVKRLQHEYGITTIMVTHDQEEALSMSDRVVVMRHGAIGSSHWYCQSSSRPILVSWPSTRNPFSVNPLPSVHLAPNWRPMVWSPLGRGRLFTADDPQVHVGRIRAHRDLVQLVACVDNGLSHADGAAELLLELLER